jgi:7-cyano-7-deazaguanine synthase
MKAIVLLSGGQDSATCLLWAVQRWGINEVTALFADYGQRHAVERDAALRVAKWLEVPMRIAQVDGLGGGSYLTDQSLELDTTGPPNTFVPGRNLVLALHAAIFGVRHGADTVVLGVSQEDYEGYPDCRPETIESLQATIRLGLDIPDFELYAPLLYLSKRQTWELAERLGGSEAVKVIREVTHTCYRGERDEHPWGAGCGDCPACELRKKGWEQYLEGMWCDPDRRNGLPTGEPLPRPKGLEEALTGDWKVRVCIGKVKS